MPATAYLPILPAVSVPAGGSRLAPNAAGVSPTVEIGSHFGGAVTAKFTNGTTGPTAAAGATVYGSHDGTKWTELGTIWGDTVVSSVQSPYVDVDPPFRFLRADAWGNTGQAVTVEIWVVYLTSIA